MNKISLFLAMFLFSGIANAEMLNSKHIYSFAKSGDYSSLERYSRWIDITNSDGDTAVCLAIKNNDVNSYNLLLNYGANSRPNCYAKAIKSVSGSAKSGTFLGMSGTGWAVTGGVLAAGGIAAAAGGGGGGGGSSSSQPSPVICSNQGSLVEGVCQCNTGYSGSQCEKCDDGYIKYNGSCYQKLSCANGSQKENECVCDAGYAGSLCNEADENHIIGSDGNLYDKLNCINGNQVNASCNCADGWEGATCETAASCSYDTIECAYGYKETGSICKSGNTTYKECVFDDENFIQQGGNVYPKLECKNGGVQTGAACTGCNEGWEGETCETAADCGYDTIECAYGYKETNNTCKSGDTTYKKCVFDDENFIQQDGNVYPKLDCKNGGVQTGTACTGCNEGWEGTLCDKADSNHIIGSDGNLYDKLNCVNGVQNKDICVCNTGYAGILCNEAAEGYILFDGVAYPKLSCVNGEQNKDKCVCNSGWGGTLCNEADENHIIGSDGNLYERLNCVNGNQVNASCNCAEGWEGATCETAASCGYDTIECAYGYKETNNTCKSGNTTYKECVFDDENFIQQGGNVYPKLECKNGGVQEASTCNCVEGWDGATCETAAACGYDTIECAYGYKETGSTCKSGNTTYKECVFDDEHFIQQGGNVYPKLECKNGGVQEANTCNCVDGWTGTLCDTPVDCGTNYKETCASNEYTTEETCTSGGNNLKKCLVHSEMPNCQTLSSTSDTCEICKTGYAGTTCSQAADGYTLFDDIAYPTLACANGSTQDKDHCTCEDGWTGTLCNTPADCDYTTTSCLTGYKTTGNSCKSGEAIYVECVFDDENFIQQDGNVYPKLECKNGGVQTGAACTGCNEGWEGTLCDKADSNHIIGSDGNLYDKLNCVNGIQNKDICVCNTGYAGILCNEAAEGYILFDGVAYPKLSCVNGEQNKDKCVCNSGWGGTLCDEADENHIIGIDGNLYDKLNCVNGNQVNASCNCTEGWIGTLCDTPVDCEGFNLTSTPANCQNYEQCMSGATPKYKCTQCKSGYGKNGNGQCVTKSADIIGNATVNTSVTLNNSDYADVYGKKAQKNANKATSVIKIKNNSDANVYGIFDNNDTTVYNTYDSSRSGGTTYITKGNIEISNRGNGNVYGIYGTSDVYNTYTTALNILYSTEADPDIMKAFGTITINNEGNGDVYGIYSYGGTNAYSLAEDLSISRGISTSIINVENNGLGNAYGFYNAGLDPIKNASTSGGRAIGKIIINNKNNGNAYGMYSEHRLIHNAANGGGSAEGIIIGINSAGGKLYGMYGGSQLKNLSINGKIKSTINIINKSKGLVYGMYGGVQDNSGTIEIANIGEGQAVGMYAKNENIHNSGNIIIHNLGEGQAVGIYIDGGTATNSGTIRIDRDSYTDKESGTTYSAPNTRGSKNLHIGIYGTATSTVKNTGTIVISGAHTGYGIHLEKGGTLENSGTISIINGTGLQMKKTGDILFEDGVYKRKNTILTNSLSLASVIEEQVNNDNINNSILNTFNLDDMGGKVVATEKAVFEVHGAIAGHLTMSSDIVSKGFKDTYTTNGTIDAEDTSGLCLVSQSALFNASLAENNSDVVMKMKAFNEVVDNQSLAGFLQNNYALENNESFFNTLKKQETVTSLNDALGDLSGKKLFSRFADEDLTMMRELTFDVNNKLFMNNDDHLETSGNVSTFNFSSNKGSDNRYALISQNYGNYQLGLNYGFANVRSDDDDNNRRNERMFHVGMPISYGKQGFKFITTPHLGYSSGTYNRKGFNNENYEGNVEKTMFGLVNEARYPFALGKWTIAPGAEFNVVDYRTQGHEKGGTYKLRLAAQNNYSVEAGVGLYANAEHKFSEKSKLTFTNGLTMYHEFADPYKMQVGVCGMSGEFNIRDEKRSDNRAVIRTGLSYVNDNISLSGNVMSYIDKEYRTNAVLDFKYAF